MAQVSIGTHHDQQMLAAHPRGAAFDATSLLACLQACLDCTQSCVSCADACSAEEDPKMLAKCIRTNNDCADLCAATARILARQTEPDLGVVSAALVACATACALHSMHILACSAARDTTHNARQR